MEVIFEIIFEIFAEFFLQIVVEIMIELGFQGLANTVIERKERNKYYAFIGYCILGVVVGLFSLMLFPRLFITDATLVYANLVITPVIAGLVMSAWGKWRSRRGKALIRLDSFTYGFAFAFCMALTRYWFGEFGV